MVPWVHPSPHTKQHLDWFSHSIFSTAHGYDQKHTDRPRTLHHRHRFCVNNYLGKLVSFNECNYSLIHSMEALPPYLQSTAHTHTHPFNGPFSRTTRVSQYQKGKTNLDFTEARDSEWQWHQLRHMQVCT